MKLLPLSLAIAAAVAPMSAAHAQAIISATGAVINVGGPGDGSIADTYNHNGLLTNYVSGVTNFDTYIAGNPQHNYVFAGNEWFSTAGTTAATVTYDLGSVLSFDRFALWNEDVSGVGSVQLLVSSDNSTFTAFTSFSPTNNTDNQNYGAQVFSFATQTGRYVRFAATGCPQAPGSYSACAIGEVAFRAAAATPSVPEPASWSMMIAGFGLVGAAVRRRKAAVSFA